VWCRSSEETFLSFKRQGHSSNVYPMVMMNIWRYIFIYVVDVFRCMYDMFTNDDEMHALAWYTLCYELYKIFVWYVILHECDPVVLSFLSVWWRYMEWHYDSMVITVMLNKKLIFFKRDILYFTNKKLNEVF